MFWLIDGPRCPSSGPELLKRIAALQHPARVRRIVWFWRMVDF